jgi:hypothetical protein
MQQDTLDIINRIQAELNELDANPVEIDGKKLKPSQCYHFNISPAHVLFNTNCPDTLRQRVEEILAKYLPDEGGTQ